MEQSSTWCVNHAVPAEGGCAQCGRPFCAACLITLRGKRVCAACKHVELSGSFSVYTAVVPAAAGTMPVAAPAGSACSAHPQAAAVAICERCGDFACVLCTTPFEGHYYCLSCFELLWHRGGLSAAVHRRSVLPAIALISAVIAVTPCYAPLQFLAGLAGAGLATAALLTIKREDDRGGRNLAVAAVVLSVIGLGMTAGLLLWQSSP